MRKKSFGIALGYDSSPITLEILGIKFHNHPEEYIGNCPFAFGFEFALCNVLLAVGLFYK